MSTINRFNIRAYFLLLNDDNELLVSDEIIAGKQYTKLPGGGVEFGEGIEDAVKREALEELGQEVEIVKHVYTTGFFIQSAFKPTDQVISVYYQVRLLELPKFKIASRRFDFDLENHQTESFRWVHIGEINLKEFAFPADRFILERIATDTPL